ncbi:aldehyde dehydrogenase family protein, partial [Staphylococcus capitis]|uniref:aldehyde dehydrogenase family protein n=1 Tax=Staphylococcus capitis TaxID=29388 RepID=UPI003CFD7534
NKEFQLLFLLVSNPKHIFTRNDIIEKIWGFVGPVVTVEGFADEEEVIRLANDSIYGLAGAVFTKDIGKAQRVANKLKLGTVWINDFHPYFAQAPWGGYKQSGIGRELGKEGLEEYLITKHILTNTNPEPVNWFSK